MDIRIGMVNLVKEEEGKARVFFEDLKMMSGWLKILKRSSWIPNVGDVVLCIYNNEFNSDGFILGAL